MECRDGVLGFLESGGSPLSKTATRAPQSSDGAERDVEAGMLSRSRGELDPCSFGAGVARCRPLPEPQELSASLQAISCNRRDVQCGSLSGTPEADTPTWVWKFLLRDRKSDSQAVGCSLNGTHLGLAKLHVTYSKDKAGSESGLRILGKLFILNNMAERVGSEFTRKRSFNNVELTAGPVKQWKTVVSSANGSQMDHDSVIA